MWANVRAGPQHGIPRFGRDFACGLLLRSRPQSGSTSKWAIRLPGGIVLVLLGLIVVLFRCDGSTGSVFHNNKRR